MPLKVIKGMALAFALMVMAQGAVHAQTVEVSGSTSGTLGNPASDPGLSFSGSSFDVTTAGGFASIGNAGSGTNNLGVFTLNNTTPLTTYNDTFSLLVNFTLPQGTAGNPGTYQATVTGTVQTVNGGATIDFNPPSQTFNFSNASQSGTFSLFVNNIDITPGDSVNVTGHVNAALTPEPGSLALFLPGLFGLGSLLRRRKVV